MIGAIKKSLINLPYQASCIFKKLNPNNNFLIFSDPRSGSTWLSEILKSIPNSLLIDEPLNVDNSKELERLKFGWRQHIPEGIEWKEAKIYFESIFSAQALNRNLCFQNKLVDLITFDKLVIKIIRGKSLLPWLCEQFEFKYKPILLVRHPFAVISSMKNHSSWNYEFTKFDLPDSPHIGHYEKHFDFLSSLTSKEEQLVALWCIGNNHVLRHPKNNKNWISVNYENLLFEPEKTFDTIFSTWNIRIPNGLIGSLKKPSSTTVGKNKIDPMVQLESFKSNISLKMLHKLNSVLYYFEVDYYNEESVPLINADQVHLKL